MSTSTSCRRRPETGFSLVELLLVASLTGTLAAVAVPVLGRARATALEVSTIGSLRAIHSAQSAFATSCAGGSYAPSIPWLARLPKGARNPFIAPPFVADTTDRYGYRLRFSAGPKAAAAAQTCNGLGKGQAVSTFFVAADLLQPTNGLVRRYFGVNQNGVVYESTKRVRPFYAGEPPSPARPIN